MRSLDGEHVSSIHTTDLLKAVNSTFDGEKAHMPYINALLGVQKMLKTAVHQFTSVEKIGFQVA